MSEPETGETDEFVRECLDDWTPRFIVNGVDYSDLSRLRDRIDTWAEWCPAWRALGDEHAELGAEALEAGNPESAAQHFVDASMCYHFGSHVWHVDEEYRAETHDAAVESFQRAAPHLDPPAERVEATHEGATVAGNLRVPDAGPDGASGDSPVVFVLPGLDSVKEELSAYDPIFHERGIATLAVDGPAQGETHAEKGMTPRYHEWLSALLDELQDRDPDGADTSSVGITGVSLGGFYAPQTAAHDDRFDACVGISGPFTVGPVSGSASDLSKEQYKWACKTDSLVEVDEITDAMSLRACIDDLTQPSLMITGEEDYIIPPEQTERIADRAPNCEYVLYPEGNHVCNNVGYKYKPLLGDWFRDELA